jgi:iron complex transport system ATP-binding protein
MLAVTQQLDVPTETVPPLSEPDAGSVATTRERIKTADVTVLADLTLAPSGKRLDLAAAAPRLAVVEERPLSERNYASDRGKRRYRRLCGRGTRSTTSEIASAVVDVAAESARQVDRRET